MTRDFIISLGAAFRTWIYACGGGSVMAGRALWKGVMPPYNPREVIRQIEQIGSRSMTIVVLMAIFSGMVITIQFAFGLTRFGAKPYVGKIVALSLLRELGPVLTALMVAGRAGSGIAAEIGSMKVTEQIDAIRALGADPIFKLVTPRIIATILVLPILTAMANLVGIAGAMFIAKFELDIPPIFFYRSIVETVKMQDLVSGLAKTLFFGFEIAAIACYGGLQAEGGTEGVGAATTKVVVGSSIVVMVSDFFLTKLFLSI